MEENGEKFLKKNITGKLRKKKYNRKIQEENNKKQKNSEKK